MARPPRLELPNAWHYVRNESVPGQPLFRSQADTETFLGLLAECSLRHGARWHAYCLLDDSYHLLVFTPEANLNRIMRHINGVYTQHYHRRHQTSGPLFRQRYKSLVIDGEQIALPLSRYLHRLAVNTHGSLEAASKNGDSSLRHYLGASEIPVWLHIEIVRGLKESSHDSYGNYLQEEPGEPFEAFLKARRQGTVVGDEGFARTTRKLSRRSPARASASLRPGLRRILRITARHFDVRQRDLMVSSRGRGVASPARSVAMYLCQTVGGMTLTDIAEAFALASYASAGSTIRNVRQRMDASPELDACVRQLQTALLAAND